MEWREKNTSHKNRLTARDYYKGGNCDYFWNEIIPLLITMPLTALSVAIPIML